MTSQATAVDLAKRIKAADARYGDYASVHEALGVALEDWDEFRLAIQSNGLGAVREEALDLAAVLIRLADQLETSEKLRARSVP
jgi:NTP pyrophosphatase (non-canonical NTP hydrolase)